MMFAIQARSQQIVAAAIALTTGWVFSLAWYWVAGRHGPSWGYAVIDLALAVYFWRASKGRWFPVPLFYIHASFIVYYIYATLIAAPPWWVIMFVNRLFELAVAYVIGCSVYRIVRLRTNMDRAKIWDRGGGPPGGPQNRLF